MLPLSAEQLADREKWRTSKDWHCIPIPVDMAALNNRVFNLINLPNAFSTKTCHCVTPGFQQRPPFDPMHKCTKCGKLPKWKVKECLTCRTVFIQNFRSPAICPTAPQCWDCLPVDRVCQHKSPHVMEIDAAVGIVPPPKPVDLTGFDPFADISFGG